MHLASERSCRSACMHICVTHTCGASSVCGRGYMLAAVAGDIHGGMSHGCMCVQVAAKLRSMRPWMRSGGLHKVSHQISRTLTCRVQKHQQRSKAQQSRKMKLTMTRLWMPPSCRSDTQHALLSVRPASCHLSWHCCMSSTNNGTTSSPVCLMLPIFAEFQTCYIS